MFKPIEKIIQMLLSSVLGHMRGSWTTYLNSVSFQMLNYANYYSMTSHI